MTLRPFRPTTTSSTLVVAALLFVGFIHSAAPLLQTDPQQAAILSFIAANYPTWGALTNWGSGDPCVDSWSGVFCSFPVNETVTTANYTVTSLSLGWRTLEVLPPEIANITTLELLVLDRTRLSGPLPAFLSRLSALQGLSLAHNNFTGTIPAEWANLSNLRVLYLGNNYLTSIPPEINSLTNLTVLDMKMNELTGPIPPLGNLLNLTRLHLGGNQLTGSLPSSISTLSAMQILSLKGNNLTGSVPNLSAMKNLVELYLSDNQFTGSLPTLAANATLATITMTNNRFTGSIPTTYSTFRQLKRLWLGCNQLSGTIDEDLVFRTNTSKLTQLHLEGNQLQDPLPPSLQLKPKDVNFQFNVSCNAFTSRPSYCDTAQGGDNTCSACSGEIFCQDFRGDATPLDPPPPPIISVPDLDGTEPSSAAAPLAPVTPLRSVSLFVRAALDASAQVLSSSSK